MYLYTPVVQQVQFDCGFWFISTDQYTAHAPPRVLLYMGILESHHVF